MSTSVMSGRSSAVHCPELEGARVLITGLTSTHGVDLARLFADHRCRLVLQMPDTSSEAEALLEILAQSAADIRVTSQHLGDGEPALAFAQQAAQSFGGLDLVINLISLDGAMPAGEATPDEIECCVADSLRAAFNITRVAANRMLTTWVPGLILNVLYAPSDAGQDGTALTCIARVALASMTRAEAGRFAEHGVRINAIGPRDLLGESSKSESMARSEPEVAALALYLASKRGRGLSGQVFDMEIAPAGCC